MRVITKNLKNRKLYYEKFDNFKEYIDIVTKRDKEVGFSRGNNLDARARDSWSGVSSYKEVQDLMLYGWDKEVETIKNLIKKEIVLCDTKKVVKQFNDVVGFMPIVPNAIIGLPVSMINQRNDFKKQKVIKFLIVMNRSAGYSSSAIIEKMSKIFARIVALEKAGYRCRIETFSSQSENYSSKTLIAHSVLIKSENQLLDVKRTCFPVIHSAMQRVLSFGWENSLPLDYSSYHCSSLGRSIQYWDEEERNELLNAINTNNEKIVLVGMESNIEKVFGEEVK